MNDLTIIYYTDDSVDEPLKSKVVNKIESFNLPLVKVYNDGAPRSFSQIYKNILKGLESVETKYVGLAEHDVIYEKEHFEFIPPEDDIFYYNTNHIIVQEYDYLKPIGDRKTLSQLICNKDLLLKAIKHRIEHNYEPKKGLAGACEFGVIDNYHSQAFRTKKPNYDYRTKNSFTGKKKGKRIPPPGRWYQEATINGIKMPTRRTKDTNERRWKNLIKPFVEPGEGRFTELGCNAGFYLRKASDLGYKGEGVEKSELFYAHAKYLQDMEPRNVSIIKSDIRDYNVKASKYVLIANVHYWLKDSDNKKLVKQLIEKACNVIVVGRFKTLKVHRSPCHAEYVKDLFKDWELVGQLKSGKHFSLSFRNNNVVERDVNDLTLFQPFMKSHKFKPSFDEFIDLVLSDRKFDPTTTSYADYLRWRRFRNKKQLLKRHIKLIKTVSSDGIYEPLLIGRLINGKFESNVLKDGDHRLILLKKLGIKKVICKMVEQKPKNNPNDSLSVIIPARNEVFLRRTIEDILENATGDTEIIAILDGYWPEPNIIDDNRVTLVHHTKPIGQRAGCNEGARISRRKYIMKCDAHCAFDKGFDTKLMNDYEKDWTVIPRMYNLHAFDFVCTSCGNRKYQGPTPEKCDKCGNNEFDKDILWKPRLSRRTDFARFDKDLHFQYWKEYETRPEAKGDIADVMSSVGACWFLSRERYFELDGMDERHGSWGQMGTEISCKAWLSGGRHVVNKKTWFAHMFRTKKDFGFPYKITFSEQEAARKYSRSLWMNNNWNKASRKLDWIIDKFSPVPDWS
jgi:hypothetical protein